MSLYRIKFYEYWKRRADEITTVYASSKNDAIARFTRECSSSGICPVIVSVKLAEVQS